MRWFKHITTSYHDEKIQQMIDAFGLLGYGFYFAIVERIACQLDGKNQTSLRLKKQNWMRYLCISRVKQLKKMLDKCEEIKLFEIQYEKDEIIINCPNLLKFRDEWTARMNPITREPLGSGNGVNPERLGSKSKKTESEIEEDKKKEKEKKEKENERRRQREIDRFSASFDADLSHLILCANGKGMKIDWQATKIIWMNWIGDNWKIVAKRKNPRATFVNWITKNNPFYSPIAAGKGCQRCGGTGIDRYEDWSEELQAGVMKDHVCQCMEQKP